MLLCVLYSLGVPYSGWNVPCITVGTDGSILELDTLQQKGRFPKYYYLTEWEIIFLLILELLGILQFSQSLVHIPNF